MILNEKKLVSILRAEGYKMTPQRRAVLKAISESHDHMTAAALFERVKKGYPNIGLVTIYRTLGILQDLDLICEVHAERDSHSYLMRRPSEHHHHIICAGCGTVADFAGCDLTGIQQQLCRETGFEIEGHLLEFFGYCETCKKP